MDSLGAKFADLGRRHARPLEELLGLKMGKEREMRTAE
jgi:hypothetical protein